MPSQNTSTPPSRGSSTVRVLLCCFALQDAIANPAKTAFCRGLVMWSIVALSGAPYPNVALLMAAITGFMPILFPAVPFAVWFTADQINGDTSWGRVLDATGLDVGVRWRGVVILACAAALPAIVPHQPHRTWLHTIAMTCAVISRVSTFGAMGLFAGPVANLALANVLKASSHTI